MGLLGCTGRHTITGMMAASGRSDHDWTASYRAFSRCDWDILKAFDVAIEQLAALSAVSDVVVTAMDDTKVRKSGTKIPGVSYQRDPMSPPFHVNLIRAQRFVQLSWNVPFSADPAGPARAFPIDFRHAPPPPKPSRTASDQQHAHYRKAASQQNLSHVGVRILTEARDRLDRHGAADRQHITSVDGSYTNKTVLKNLPPRTTLIGRIRKDAVLYYEPREQPERGRKRWYGDAAPTPEQLRQDEAIPWQGVSVFAAGRIHPCQIKTLAPLLWRTAGASRLLRLIVIRPLGYRLTASSRILYRQPAYLICTDPDLPLERVIQWYFWRWDIEVNHRDEKQLIGLGHAQVRTPQSADRLPAFAVLTYTFLLIASARCFGLDATRQALPLPPWRRSHPNNSQSARPLSRLSTNQMLSHFRDSLSPQATLALRPNFSDFAIKLARHAKCPKSSFTQAQAIAYATH